VLFLFRKEETPNLGRKTKRRKNTSVERNAATLVCRGSASMQHCLLKQTWSTQATTKTSTQISFAINFLIFFFGKDTFSHKQPTVNLLFTLKN
jgi:hypothetical protein